MAVALVAAVEVATQTGMIAEAVDTAMPPTTTTQANMLRMGMRSHPHGTGISGLVIGSPFICNFFAHPDSACRTSTVRTVGDAVIPGGTHHYSYHDVLPASA
jgi:hypothetical protein